MSIAYRVQDYLAERDLPWDPLPHRSTPSCMASAHEAHLRPEHIAKAVVLEGEEDRMLAVIPADHSVDLARMGEAYGQEFHLAPEGTLRELFPDCEPGAVPPVGEAYGMRTAWDPSLGEQRHVYFEGGDHRTLVHMSGADFGELMRFARPMPGSRKPS